MSQDYDDNFYDNNNEDDYGYGYSSYGGNTPPDDGKRNRKRKGGTHRVRRVLGSVLVVVLLLGAVAGGSYMAFSNIRDSLSARIEERTEEAIEEVSDTEEEETAPQTTLSRAESSTLETTSTGSVALMDVSDVVQEIKPSVVQVTNNLIYTISYGFSTGTQEGASVGTGVIIGENDSELLIVTNNHVIADDSSSTYSATSSSISVTFIDDTIATANIKGADETVDVAVLAVSLEDLTPETLDAIKIATVGDSETLLEGEGVIAIGNAMGYGLSVTTGVVSALNREVTINDYTNLFIQTDAAINPGNSGGGLFNTRGELIGINDAKLVDSEVEGIGYAIPISAVSDILEEMMNQETRIKYSDEEKGYLGIQGQDVTSSIASVYNMPEGILITYIYEGSGADEAGLQLRDIITEFNGKTYSSYDSFRSAVSYYTVGEEIELTIMRLVDGEYVEMTVNVTLGEAPAETTTEEVLPEGE